MTSLSLKILLPLVYMIVFFFHIDCLYVYINSALLAYYFVDKHLYCFFIYIFKYTIIYNIINKNILVSYLNQLKNIAKYYTFILIRSLNNIIFINKKQIIIIKTIDKIIYERKI